MNSEEIEFLSMNNAVLHNQVEHITKQRDELLAALEKIELKCNLDMHSDDGSLGGYAYGIWNTAHAAIAAVRGAA